MTDKSTYSGRLLQAKGLGEKKEEAERMSLFWVKVGCDLTVPQEWGSA